VIKKKIKIKNWQVACLHWLFAGIAMPFLFSAIFGVVVSDMIQNFGVVVWLAILGEVVKFFIIWISIIYSAKYINSKFIIENKINIVRLATIYLVFFVGGFRLLFFNTEDVMGYIFSSMHLISLLVITPFFYFVSKYYIKDRKELKEEEKNKDD
jgi:hypothetical protein